MPDIYYSSLLYGGFLLGMLHALDADHVATVSTLILDRHPWRRTAGLALRWAAGHSLTLLMLAALALVAKALLANAPLTVMERVVGLSMVYIGLMFLMREWNRYRRPADFERPALRRTGWVLFGMGVLHGTAGWSSIFLMVPVALFESPAWVLAYIGLFCAGMILTMGLYATLVHHVSWLEGLTGHLAKLRCVSALITLTIGLRLTLVS